MISFVSFIFSLRLFIIYTEERDRKKRRRERKRRKKNGKRRSRRSIPYLFVLFRFHDVASPILTFTKNNVNHAGIMICIMDVDKETDCTLIRIRI